MSTPQNGVSLDNNAIIATGSYMIDLKIDLSLCNQFEFSIGNSREKLALNYYQNSGEFLLDRSNSGIVDFNNLFVKLITCKYMPQSKTLPIKIVVDQSSIEIFVNNGEKAITSLFFPKYDYSYLKITSNSTNNYLKYIALAPLKKSISR
jgi:sucrose-6-phosphate hydrolase SacC (GH32 family)